MNKRKDKMFVRPLEVDVGRGLEPARLRFKRGNSAGFRWFELPVDGAVVPWNGRERRFWKRREAEGVVEILADKPRAPKTKPSKSKED